jgi:hypothetical protein
MRSSGALNQLKCMGVSILTSVCFSLHHHTPLDDATAASEPSDFLDKISCFGWRWWRVCAGTGQHHASQITGQITKTLIGKYFIPFQPSEIRVYARALPDHHRVPEAPSEYSALLSVGEPSGVWFRQLERRRARRAIRKPCQVKNDARMHGIRTSKL